MGWSRYDDGAQKALGEAAQKGRHECPLGGQLDVDGGSGHLRCDHSPVAKSPPLVQGILAFAFTVSLCVIGIPWKQPAPRLSCVSFLLCVLARQQV